MMVGALLTPSATAVTLAMPSTPGLQRTGLLRESHLPAQATPLLEISRAALLSETKWMVVNTVRPAESWAVALKFWARPNSRESVEVGLRVTVWTPLPVGFGVLLPTQPERTSRAARANM